MASQERSFQAMGSPFVIRIDVRDDPMSSPDTLDALLSSLQQETESIEQSLSRFRPDSELTKLNQRAGDWVQVSQRLRDVLLLTRRMYTLTDGAFDPRILSTLERIGYRGARVTTPHRPPSDLSTPEAPVLFRGTDEVRVATPIDLGGIGKGYTSDQLAATIEANLPASVLTGYIVDAGGDLVVAGHQASGEAWAIGIENPFDPPNLVAAISPVRDGRTAICTSSVMRKKWTFEGTTVHHMIDPASAEPVRSPLVSVTTIASSAAHAEIITKYIFLRDTDNEAIWLGEPPAYLWVDETYMLTCSAAMEAHLTWLAGR